MHLFKNSLFILLYLIEIQSFSQKNITNQKLVWYEYFQTLQINEKSYWQTEVQERHYFEPFAQHQFLFRGHYHQQIMNSNWEASAGLCVFFQNPNDPTAANKLTIPELRPHIEFANKQKFSKLILDHRYRAESRFFHNLNDDKTDLEEGYNFGNYRFRYRLQASYPLFKFLNNREISIKISDELHLNAGKNIIGNVFEQNRIYLGLSTKFSSNFTFDAGYLNWFQQRPNGDFFNRDIIRFTAYHKINIRKKNVK